MVTQNAAAPSPPEPEVVSAYTHGWKQLWKYFGELFLIMVIYYVIIFVFFVPAAVLQAIYDNTGFIWPIVSWLFSLFILLPIAYGISYAFLKASRGDKVDIADMFGAFKNYWSAFLANILVIVIVLVGIIFLIVPGIYLGCKLAFVPFLVVDKKVDAFRAIELSWKMTNGVGWHIFLIGLLAIPIVIVGLMCFIIGVVVSQMWIYTAMASLYYVVDSRRPALPQLIVENTAPPAP